MRWKELENLLENPKGEDNIFNLYNSGKEDKIKELYYVFLDTRLPAVLDLDELLSKGGPRKKNVGCVYGKKGIGKSTLVSTAAIVNHLNKNVKDIYYHRYNPIAKKFEEVFKSERENGKNRVIVLEDIHYFLPDLIDDILKGKLSPLDNYIGELIKINKLMEEGPSILIYVSDEHSLEFLRSIISNIAEISGWDELSRLLFPPSPKSRPCYQRKIDEEFFGKTYALLKGDIKLYNVWNVATKISEEKIKTELGYPVSVRTPRMFKVLMRKLGKIEKELLKLYEDPLFIEALLQDSVEEFFESLNKTKEETIQKMYRELGEILLQFRKELNKSEEEMNKLENKIRGYKTDLKELREKVNMWNENIEALANEHGVLGNWENILNAVVEHKIEVKNRFIKRYKEEKIHEGLKREIQNQTKLFQDFLEDLESTANTYKRKVENLDEKIKYYTELYSIVKKNWPYATSKVREICEKVEEIALNVIKENPILFSRQDVDKLRELLDLDKMWEMVNKNSILLLRERRLLPY
jgi:archaellum component FlaC